MKPTTMRLAPLSRTARCLSEGATPITTAATTITRKTRIICSSSPSSSSSSSTTSSPRTRQARSRPSYPTSISHRHSYHSYDHPPPPSPFGDVESSILAAAYKHVPEHGFSDRALALGARDAGYLDISPAVFSSDGAFSLIRWHLVSRRNGLATQGESLLGAAAHQDTGSRQDVSANVAALTWARLLDNKDIIHRWQEALAIMAQPSFLPESLKELAALSDEIWFLAGDKAVDPSWYTKRAALSMVYSSSELFMTNDRSPGFIETNRFMQRRLQETQLIGGAMSSMAQFAGFTLSAGLNALRSKGVPI